ncbi:MAG: hypothetical protein ACLU0O_08245 [Collinsella sp.]
MRRICRGLRLFASYVMAHALYLRGEYGRSLGMAENALIANRKLSDLGTVPAPGSFHGMHEPQDIDAAKTHFGAAWNIARPDGLIELIGEHHGLLQGLIPSMPKIAIPDDFARIIEITYRFSYGWRRIHNPDSGEDVADDLTTTEFTMAMLACRGWTNAEIARHMGYRRAPSKTAYPAYTQSLASAHALSWSRICYVSDRTAKRIERVQRPAFRSINLDILTLERHYRHGAPSRKIGLFPPILAGWEPKM